MNGKVKRILQFICGVAMVIFGILVLLTDEMFILFCSLALIVYGVGTFLSWSAHRKTGTASMGSFWIAVVTCAAGVALLVGGSFFELTSWIVMLILGICFIASGVLEIIGAVIYRKAMTSVELGIQAPGSIASMVMGGVMILVGLTMIFLPLLAMYLIGVILAIALIVAGVRTIIGSFSTGAVAREEKEARA